MDGERCVLFDFPAALLILPNLLSHRDTGAMKAR